jgi:hypothetical protein
LILRKNFLAGITNSIWSVLVNITTTTNGTNYTYSNWVSGSYGKYTFDATANNVMLGANNILNFQFTSLATGRTFYLGRHSNGRAYIKFTIV